MGAQVMDAARIARLRGELADLVGEFVAASGAECFEVTVNVGGTDRKVTVRPA